MPHAGRASDPPSSDTPRVPDHERDCGGLSVMVSAWLDLDGAFVSFACTACGQMSAVPSGAPMPA